MLITLATAKSYLKITSSTHDTLLNDLIAKASAYISTICNRVFEADDYDELYTGENDSTLILDHSPVNSIKFISDDLDFDTKQYASVIDANEILVNCGSGMIEWMGGVFSNIQRGYYVRYNAGWVTIPLDIQLVCVDLVVKKWQDIDQGRVGVASKNVMSDSVTFNYQDISKENMVILKRYTMPPRRYGIPVTGWKGAS